MPLDSNPHRLSENVDATEQLVTGDLDEQQVRGSLRFHYASEAKAKQGAEALKALVDLSFIKGHLDMPKN